MLELRASSRPKCRNKQSVDQQQQLLDDHLLVALGDFRLWKVRTEANSNFHLTLQVNSFAGQKPSRNRS